MNEFAYIVVGHTNDPPCQVWAVMIYADEEAAREHSRKAAEEANRIHNNIKRAVMIRGKPFTQAKLDRFWSNNQYDANMKLSANGAVYAVVRAPLVEGLRLLQDETQ